LLFLLLRKILIPRQQHQSAIPLAPSLVPQPTASSGSSTNITSGSATNTYSCLSTNTYSITTVSPSGATLAANEVFCLDDFSNSRFFASLSFT
jgi:hypothetical protein